MGEREWVRERRGRERQRGRDIESKREIAN